MRSCALHVFHASKVRVYAMAGYPTPLRVGFAQMPLDGFYEVTKWFTNTYETSHPCDKPGFEIEIFTVIMRMMNITDYEFVFADRYGSPRPDINGTWNGLIGMVISDEVDISAVTLRATMDRTDKVHFSQPLWTYQDALVYVTPSDRSIKNFLLAPFSTTVWVAIFVCFVACVVLAIVGDYPHIGESVWQYYSPMIRQVRIQCQRG